MPLNRQHLESQFSDELDGQAILRQTVARYESAKSYRDQAILYLNYRLEGRPIQEPHPFSTVWDAEQRLSIRVFNSQIQCDGNLLSCFVFDNDTANLDNQQLFLPVSQMIPVSQLYQDAIVRHFVGGYAELPLDETQKSSPPKLIPPPLSLLTKQLPFGWLQNSAAAQRLNDQTIDERLCYVVRSLFDESTADIWIDQQSLILVQISLPLRLMARPVLTSGEIADVELVVRFHQAAIDQPADPSGYAVQLRNNATAVRQFVSIPEPFPSDLIGQTVPPFDLIQSDGKPINQLHFDGQPTALLWLGGNKAIESLEKYILAAKEFSPAQFNVAAIYSESELADPGASSLDPAPRLKLLAKEAGMPMYFDRQLAANTILRIKTNPSVIVLNGDSRLAFARALSDDKWTSDLAVALSRVKRGDDVAAEMKTEYQRFLREYHANLKAASATDWVAGKQHVAENTTGSTNGLAGHDNSSIRLDSKNLAADLIWSSNKFDRPGNIVGVRSDSQTKWLVFDGWRTAVELDQNGKSLGRHELELPDQVAVSCLRRSHAKDPRQVMYAVFDVQAAEVYLFDSQWHPVATLPDKNFEHGGIQDVQFVDDESNRQLIAVSFVGNKGTYVFDLHDRTTTQASSVSALSLASSQGKLYFCSTEDFGVLAAGASPVSASSGLSYRKLSAIGDPLVGLCLTMVDRERNWSAAGIGVGGKFDWQQPIGSQLFENEIEPMVGVESNEFGYIFGVVDTSHRIQFFSAQGIPLGELTLTNELTGIALTSIDKQIQVAISHSQGVSCYRLRFDPSPIRPVSDSNKK